MAVGNLSVGDVVTINTPYNPRLHNTQATVEYLCDWGAHLKAPAAATGRFRALYSEMEPVQEQSSSRAQGYTGDICDACQGARVRRNGTCLLCDDCGTTSGCS